MARRSSSRKPRLLCAFPDHRCGSAARRGRGRVPQLVTADGERPLLFSPAPIGEGGGLDLEGKGDRKSTRLNSSHQIISYAVFCLKKKTHRQHTTHSDQ